MVTKWDLIDDDARTALDNTSCNVHCSGCDKLLATEGDFARHFRLLDVRYLNLGSCPEKSSALTVTPHVSRWQ